MRGEHIAGVPLSAEEALRGGPGEQATKTDADGRFDLEGLLDRVYELAAYDPRTAAVGGLEGVPAGSSGVDVVLRREPGSTRVAGRVVTPRGEPLAGVWVTPVRSGVFDDRTTPPGLAYALGRVTTDAEGRFAFEELATDGTILQLQAEQRIFLRTVPLAEHADLANLVLVEPLLCELQVQLDTQPDLGDVLFVLDARGEKLRLLESRGAFFHYGTFAKIQDGRSGVLRVPETGCTLLLQRGSEEVARRTIELDPQTRLTVRF